MISNSSKFVGEGLTYDDVLLIPAYSEVLPREVNLQSKFYAPEKAIFGQFFSTYWVNMVVIWLFTIMTAIILYFDLLKKVVDGIGNFRENQMYKRKKKEEKEE